MTSESMGTASIAELICPICLISSNDNDTTNTNNEDQVKFLKTACNHHFCQPCIERVLLKRSDNIITMGPCPMCRVPVILFDLEYTNSDDNDSSARYIGNSDVSTWPVANAQYKQELSES